MSPGIGGSGAGGVGGSASGGAGSLQADAPLLALQNSGVTGSAHFVDLLDQVTLSITLTGCPAGPHAVHLHANAACDDEGNAAGGHWSPQGEGLGDVMCGADGAAQFSFSPQSGTWTIGGAAATDVLPHAVVLHEGPNVDPGARIACGIPQKLP
jgi:Cu/Zn superoxide dismutase